MELNIQAIADEKIRAMHESGQIKTRIEKDIEDTVLKAIDSAINGYEIRRDIEKQVSENVSACVKDVGFSAYNGFIASAVKRITEEVMREDVAQKIQHVFDGLLVSRHDGIKLSEIFAAYRKWVCETTEEPEKYERQEFTCDLDVKEDGSFTHYKIRFHDQALSRSEEPEIEFRICVYGEKDRSSISSLYLDGNSMKGAFKLGRMSEVQALLANLYFNKTEILLDVDDVDDDSGFDIDI